MKNLSKFLFLTFAILTPGLVFAANIFEPPSGDISIKILDQLFGGLLNGGNDAFGEAIQTFNGAILAVGGILAAYTVLAGTLGTAHDGEMLGKKFSSVWIPIRYSLGTALVLPITSAGYCGMQMLVMWLITQGVGLADMVWNSYLNSPNALLTAKVQSGTKEAILKFAEGVALATACTNTLQYTDDKLDPVLKINSNPYTYDFSKYVNGQINFGRPAPIANGINQVGNSATGLGVTAGATAVGSIAGPIGAIAAGGTVAGVFTIAGGLDTSNECGIATTVVVPSVKNDSAVAAAGGSNGYNGNGKLGSFGKAFTITQPTVIYEAHAQEALKVLAAMNNAAKTASNNNPATSIPYSKVQEVAANYVKSIEAAGISYIANDDPFKEIKEQSKEQGWLLAGAWFTKLTLINSQLQTAMNVTPTASGVSDIPTGLFSFPDEALKRLNIVQSEVLTAQGQYKQYDGSTLETKKETGNWSDDLGFTYNNMVKGLSKIILGVINIDIQNLQNDTRPAVIIIQEIGSSMIDFWQGAMAAIIGAATVGALLGSSGQAVINTVLGFLMVPIGALVVIGFTLAYLLPNLPFLMWTGVVLGWIIMTIEAIIAAPLWAIMHLHPNGDDLTGRGGNGYMLLLGLILRPALTIFGLIAALVVTDLMGEFINKIFFNIFYVGDATGFRALMVIIFAVAVYTMAMFSMFKKTFSLMHVIPDQLMQWIGGGQSQLGQYAGSVADEAGKGVGSASVVSGVMGKGVVDGLAGAGQAKQQLNKQKEETAQTRRAADKQEEGNLIASLENQTNAENQDDRIFGTGVGEANSNALSVPHTSGDKIGQDSRSPLQVQKDRLDMRHAQNSIKVAGGTSQDAINYANQVKEFKSSNPTASNSDAISKVQESFMSSIMSRTNNQSVDISGSGETEIKDKPIPTETK